MSPPWCGKRRAKVGSASPVGARFSPAALGQDHRTPGGQPPGLSLWPLPGTGGESPWKWRAIAFRSRGSGISKNMNFCPEAGSRLSPSCPECDKRPFRGSGSTRAGLRFSHPDQAGKRHLLGSALPGKSPPRPAVSPRSLCPRALSCSGHRCQAPGGQVALGECHGTGRAGVLSAGGNSR